MKKVLICSLLLTIGACTKDHIPVNEDDFLSFGTAYGMCAGDCARLYQVREGKLYPDNIQRLYVDPVIFGSVPLPDSLYQLAKGLPALLPAYLIQHPDTVLGCPECYDQGVIYVELNQKGRKTHWKMDTNIGALPVEVRPFAQQILSVMEQLH